MGNGDSHSRRGHANHFSMMLALANGVARLMAATPAAARNAAPLPQRSALACRSPSVLITSQVAPSSAYPPASPNPTSSSKPTNSAPSPNPVTTPPSIIPCATAAPSEPTKKRRFHNCWCQPVAFARNSNATPRNIRATSMSATGRYSAVRITPWACGKATSKMPTPSTSQVSFASQNGPIDATIMSCSSGVASGTRMPTPRSNPSRIT